MNSYIKYIVEAFDFGSVNKQNKSINVYDTLLPSIIEKVKNYGKLSNADYNALTSFTGIYKVKNFSELYRVISWFLEQFGDNSNLNWIDTSAVTEMSELFFKSNFNGDISKWDVSNVTNMRETFYSSHFTGDISNWDVSNVNDMTRMFAGSDFNSDISNWDVSNVKDMAGMFGRSEFNSDISNWDVSNVTGMDYMFTKTKFNQDISSWNINPNCNIDSIFKECNIQEEYKPDFSKVNHISSLKYVRESDN